MSTAEETVRVQLVERTYAAAEQNLIILTYATPSGDRCFRKERALTSFSDVRDTTAAVEADPENIGVVRDSERRSQLGTEAQQMRTQHDSDDVV
ncbi:MAG: hypothetical protein ABEI27_10870 [Halobellus sp.]|uniref:hypothetical protein n=1 Tax=Halobellus sp. TaxID=1979212 RepID=UPI0035D4FB20